MMSKEKGSCFKLGYERCHEDKNEHFALAAMIGYILSFRCIYSGGPGFESDICHNDPGAQQGRGTMKHCNIFTV